MDSIEDEVRLPPMPRLSITSPETIEKCSSLPLRESDIFIASYPKSGTTWLQHIVLSLLLADAPGLPPYNHVSDYAPFFEIDAHWQGNELAHRIKTNHDKLGRRVFNTHLRFDMLPRGNAAKFIYIVRSPLDVCVSFFHHLSNQKEGGYQGTLDDFFNEWMLGSIAFGSWSDHILSYAPAFANVDGDRATTDDGRMFLFLTYEDMVQDLAKAVKSLVRFLGLQLSEQQQDELLPKFSFAHMKSNIDLFQPKSVTWKNQEFSFLRNGKTGSAKQVLSKEQFEEFFRWIEKSRFEERIREKCKDNIVMLAAIRSYLDQLMI